MFLKTILKAIKSSVNEEESKTVIISKAAQIIRREINKSSFEFQGNFSEERSEIGNFTIIVVYFRTNYRWINIRK